MLAIHPAPEVRLHSCQLLFLAQSARPRTHHRSIVPRCVGRDLTQNQENINRDNATICEPSSPTTREGLIHRGGSNRRHVHSEAHLCPGRECSRATITWASAEVLNCMTSLR
jgi:hypothetical protein